MFEQTDSSSSRDRVNALRIEQFEVLTKINTLKYMVECNPSAMVNGSHFNTVAAKLVKDIGAKLGHPLVEAPEKGTLVVRPNQTAHFVFGRGDIISRTGLDVTLNMPSFEIGLDETRRGTRPGKLTAEEFDSVPGPRIAMSFSTSASLLSVIQQLVDLAYEMEG